jgi:ABC-type lipoprotein export system ATPase subunit
MSNVGSHWSRWDLHVHTPSSYVQGYGGDDDETWERFIVDLEALPADVRVLGINDYMEVDGYRRVLAAREAGRLANIDLVLPVVEFRLARFAGQEHWQRVNFHVIFSDHVDPLTIDRELLSSIHAKYNLSDDDVWSGPPLRDRLEDLGRRIKNCAPLGTTHPSDLITGFNNFNVEPADIEALLNRSDAFAGKFLTAVGMAEWDQMRWSGSAAEKRSIVNGVDFVLTAAPTQAAFDRSRKRLEDNTVQSRLLHSSDAHDFSTSTEPNRVGRTMTWIKAIPSFDGLMLARHEYEQRVFAGPEPQELKSVREMPTKYLRSVGFERAEGQGAPWFDGAEVELNAGLVAIIGNKGSGKSALTDAIALVAETEVEDHLSFLSAGRFRQPRTGGADAFSCRLIWRSGDSERKRLGAHTDRLKPERVRYLPQNYFERLCSDIGDESYAEFERELKRVVFSWLPVDQRLGRATLDELMDATTNEWRERHRLRRSELSELNRQIATLERELQPSAERELRNRLADRKRELEVHEANAPAVPAPGDDAAATPEDEALLQEIDRLVATMAELDDSRAGLAAQLAAARIAGQHADEIEHRLANVELYVEQQFESTEAAGALAALGLSASDLLTVTVNRAPLAEKVAEINAAITENSAASLTVDAEQAARSAERTHLIQQLDDRRRLLREEEEARRRWEQQRIELLGDESTVGSVRFLEAALAKMPEHVARLASLETQREAVFTDLFGDLAGLRDSYRRLFLPVQEYLATEPLLTEGLAMTVDALIRDDGFTQQFLGHIDRSKSGAFYQGGEEAVRDLIALADFDEDDSSAAFVSSVLSALRPMKEGRPTGDVDWQLRSRSDREEVYDLLFGLDYLSPHYALKFNGKEIAQLSPGERGAALLIFYILVDKSNLPIILDQPEENLDNETVSRLLVPAIREAKRRRQVIIVTHNPNLAVYCDADQIVLAELDRGSDTRITYRSGAIEEAETRRWLVNVLEGTGPAFLKRYAKYSIGEHGELVFRDTTTA